MATPKNSAKLLGYKDTPHDGVYLTYAYAPALSPANKAVFCLGILAKSLVYEASTPMRCVAPMDVVLCLKLIDS